MFTYKEEGSAVVYKKVSNQTSGNKAAELRSIQQRTESATAAQSDLQIIYNEHQQVRQLSLDKIIVTSFLLQLCMIYNTHLLLHSFQYQN